MGSRGPIVLAFVGGASVVALFLVMGYLRGPTLDASVFMMVARTMTDGGMPYVDIWDHKLPGIYIAETAISWLPFDPWSRAWLLTFVSTLGTLAILAWAIGRSITNDLIVLAGVVLAGAIVLSSDYSAHGGGYTESLAVLPATAGFILGASSWSTATSRVFLSGLALGAAVIVSPQFVPAAVATFVVVCAHQGRLRRGAALVIGGAIVPSLVLGWLAINGAIPAAIDTVVDFLRVYRTRYPLIDIDSVPIVFFMLLMTLPLLVGAIARIATLAKRRDGLPLEVGAAIWMIGSVAWIVFQSNLAGHYVIGLLPAMMVLAAGAYRPMASSKTRRTGRTSVQHVALAAGLGVSIFFIGAVEPGPSRNPLVEAGVDRLEALTDDDDRIFVWGNEPALYMDTGLGAVDRHVYMVPLTTEGYTSPGQVDQVVAAWRADPPAVILDAAYHPTEVSTLPLLGPWRFRAEQPADLLDPLRDIVRDEYVVAETLGDWTFYVPRSAS